MQRVQHHLDGRFVDPASGRWCDSFHPFTGTPRAQVAEGNAADLRFALGAGVWTSDIGRAVRMSGRIQAGTVRVDTCRAVSDMSRFGARRDCGLGCANGQEAIREYLQVESVWIDTGAATGNPFVLR